MTGLARASTWLKAPYLRGSEGNDEIPNLRRCSRRCRRARRGVGDGGEAEAVAIGDDLALTADRRLRRNGDAVRNRLESPGRREDRRPRPAVRASDVPAGHDARHGNGRIVDLLREPDRKSTRLNS